MCVRIHAMVELSAGYIHDLLGDMDASFTDTETISWNFVFWNRSWALSGKFVVLQFLDPRPITLPQIRFTTFFKPKGRCDNNQ